ncbi:hypothetical protein IR117_11930 [Streptococcus danieliae]|nr:hypothetical protein [Streptococcus danieliae]
MRNGAQEHGLIVSFAVNERVILPYGHVADILLTCREHAVQTARLIQEQIGASSAT